MKTALILLILCLGLATGLAAQTNYVIGAQDVLSITVFGETDLSGKYTVEQDGTFTFPLIGRVKPGGLTLRAFEQELKNRLADGYLKNPQVNAAVETYRSQRILVMGEVRAPGEYLVTGDMTLLAALARAGSPTPTAGREAVIIRAARNSKSASSDDPDTEVLRIDLGDLQAGDLTLNLPLQDGDTINVPKALSVYVSGFVKSPGAYAIDRGTTVLQVLSLAGGVTDRGSEGRTSILRMIQGKQKEVKTKLNDVVEPGDTVRVGERRF
jgi:polysaccharide export outer membrane protein